MPKVKTALIIGASRGLGLGLAQRLREGGWEVHATVRNPQTATGLANVGDVHIETLEMNDPAQLDALKARLQGKLFDLVYINAGIMSPITDTPQSTAIDAIGELFMTNVVAPIRVAEAFAGQLCAQGGVLAFMSSALGSVANPTNNHIRLYKASKAALNSMINSFIAELQRPEITFIAMHPGWVRTEMGSDQADIDVETSTRGIVEQLNTFAGKGGVHFINYKGEPIAW
ncbi:SDR family oxidoreductase [Pseudomonas sp. PSKL.D1]|uniref:SDR family oxidoreductase n=1 Tax=Pseudomonas sp. PSKL.D1 TaxID=3029060 RepID=UPI002380EF62|nr:SDR family oxidoreductase [Pseudomonas sp. PSKL.D1]WDY57405.1 SDR family oxidoreductase [Pseudomonas sp. PSKL.D1]